MVDSPCSSVTTNISWISHDIAEDLVIPFLIPSNDDEFDHILLHEDKSSSTSPLRFTFGQQQQQQQYNSLRSSVVDTFEYDDVVEVTLDMSSLDVIDEDENHYALCSDHNEYDDKQQSQQQQQQQQPCVLKHNKNSDSPPKQLRFLRQMNVLLDDDIATTTPATMGGTISTKSSSCSSNPPTPRRLSFCGGGIPEWCHIDNDDSNMIDLINVEGTINQSLGSTVETNDWCQGWQAWSALHGLARIDYNNSHQSTPSINKKVMKLSKTEEDGMKLCVQRSLRSRAFDMTLRKRRLESLKQNLNPFDDTLREPQVMQKTKSFHVTEKYQQAQAQQQRTIKMNHNKKREKTKLSLVSVLDCSSFRCSAPPNDDVNSPAAIRKEHKEACFDKGYDSDPELFTRPKPTNTTTSRNERPKHVYVPCDQNNSADWEDSALSRLVQDFMNEKITLLLHRDSRKNHSARTSYAIHAWVDRGQRLRDRIILPKFVWMLVESTQTNSTLSSTTQKNSGTVKRQCDETYSVDLLDVCKVLNVHQLDRTRYPFARLHNTFLLRTMQEDLIFEASSHEERNRLVQTLKHVVARFASKILLQDDSAIMEFFNNHRLASGPGEQPQWLNSVNAS